MTRINTNVSSLVAQNRLTRSNNDLQEALTRLSTGLRINSGKDDPAGLIASEALRSEITSINKAISNTNRANQIITTADSALGQVSALLNDVRGLVVEAANSGALSEDEIAANQLQIDSSLEAINRIAQTTTFQGRKLLDGSLDFLTSAGTNFNTISNLKIDQANLGPSGSLAVSVNVTSAAERASVSVGGITTAVAAAPSTGTLTLARQSAATSAAGSVVFNAVTTPEVQATTGTITLTSTGEFTLTAKSGGSVNGATLNTFAVNISTVAAGVGPAAGTLSTLTVDNINSEIDLVLEEGQTLADIATLLGANADVDFSVDTAGTVANGDANATAGTFASGVDEVASTATIAVTAAATGAAGNVNISFAEATGIGATPTATIDGSGNIVVTVDDTANTTLAAITTAIDGLTDFNATLTDADSITNYDPAGTAPTLTNLTGGAAAVDLEAVINIAALENGATANGRTITFAEVNGTTTPTAVVAGNGNITITVEDSDAVAVQDIIDAINDEGTYEATAEAGNTLTSYDADTDTNAVTAFANGAAASGGISQAVVFELLGKTGSEVFNVSAGTSINDLITQINLVKDATGVEASIDPDDANQLVLTSNAYGSDAFVDLRVISEGTGGTFTAAIGAGVRDSGADIVAKVNGVDASGRGNTLSINTSTLDLSITVDDGSDENLDFTITGGGALFQLGSDVVSNQQARIGITSVSSARLGGSSGRLFQLGSGETAALANDPNAAARIVTEAIDQVTSLRGRLGAFQATTLESNLVSLNDTVANLQEAESSIRDADFAQESARLTRAQILVQSGTNVLSLANQNPQNVLSLLR